MGQIIGGAAKPKRCNLNNLSQLGTPAAGEHIFVSSDNSMMANGQGNFDAYVVGDGHTAATALPLIKTYANDVDDEPTAGSDNLVKSGGVAKDFIRTNQKYGGLEVVSETGGTVPYIFESGKTYIITSYLNSNVVISHRDTPDGESSDIITLPAKSTIEYTVTSDGNYLRFGSAIDAIIYVSNCLELSVVKKDDVNITNEQLLEGVFVSKIKIGEQTVQLVTDILSGKLQRTNELAIEGSKGDTLIYNFSGDEGSGIDVRDNSYSLVQIRIPTGETSLSGEYVLPSEAAIIRAVYGDISINAIYIKQTSIGNSISSIQDALGTIDDDIESLKETQVINIKCAYTSNPNYTSAGYLVEDDYYYNINNHKLYQLQNGVTVEVSISSDKVYMYRGVELIWDDNDGLIPNISVVPIRSITSNDTTTVGFDYSAETNTIKWTNPLPSPLNSPSFSFSPKSWQSYIFDGDCFIPVKNGLSSNVIKHIEIEREDTLTDLSVISSAFDWTESAIATRQSQIYTLFDGLVSQYSDYVSKENAYTLAGISKPSYASGYETYIYHFHLNLPNRSPLYFPRPKILLVGGTHGNEIWSSLVAYAFLKQICEGSTPNYANMRATFDFEVIPCLNGYGIVNASRFNGNDVDINRNYDDNWVSGEHTGTAAFSEKESQLVRYFTEQYVPLCAFDLHSYWNTDNGGFYTVLSTIEKEARLCIKDMCFTFLKRLPSIFGGVTDDFYHRLLAAYATTAGTDATGTTAGWWGKTLKLSGTIEVNNNISYDAGTYQADVEQRSANALSVSEYTLRVQLFRYCSYILNGTPNIFF